MKKKRLFVALLIACLMTANMSVLAAESPAEPATSTEVQLVETTSSTQTQDVQVVEVTDPTVAADSGETPVMPRSIYGYAACDTHAAYGSFTVYAPGSATSSGGFTIQTAGFDAGTPIYISIKRPDGTYAIKDWSISANGEVIKSYNNALPGTFTCYFTIYGSSRGQIRLWVY